VLTTRVKVAEARNLKIDIENELERQRAVLRELTGLPQDEPVEVAGDFTVTEMSIDPDSLIKLAMERLPEARISRQAETSADIQYRLDSKADRPTLNMVLDFGFKNGYTPDLDKLEANWVAGMQLEVPVFNGFLTRHKKATSYANLLAARENSTSVERSVATEVRQALADFEAAREKVKTSEVQVEYAEAAVSIARSRYEIGVITNLDLLDAQTSVAYAKLAHLKALYGAVSSLYRLDRATGEKVWP
jgi:outer membrane protein